MYRAQYHKKLSVKSPSVLEGTTRTCIITKIFYGGTVYVTRLSFQIDLGFILRWHVRVEVQNGEPISLTVTKVHVLNNALLTKPPKTVGKILFWLVSEEIWFPFTWIRDNISHWNKSFGLIPNDFFFLRNPGNTSCALKCREWRNLSEFISDIDSIRHHVNGPSIAV